MLTSQDRLNGYSCLCASGFYGLHCETNNNDCLPQPCIHGGTCVDLVNDYSCLCPPEYTVSLCYSLIYCKMHVVDLGYRFTYSGLGIGMKKVHVAILSLILFQVISIIVEYF